MPAASAWKVSDCGNAMPWHAASSGRRRIARSNGTIPTESLAASLAASLLCNPNPTSLADWGNAATLEELYISNKAAIRPGPIIDAARGRTESDRSDALSAVSGALAARTSRAYAAHGGRVSAAHTRMWLLLRAAQDALQGTITALARNDSTTVISAEVSYVALAPLGTSGGPARAAASNGDGAHACVPCSAAVGICLLAWDRARRIPRILASQQQPQPLRCAWSPKAAGFGTPCQPH